MNKIVIVILMNTRALFHIKGNLASDTWFTDMFIKFICILLTVNVYVFVCWYWCFIVLHTYMDVYFFLFQLRTMFVLFVSKFNFEAAICIFLLSDNVSLFPIQYNSKHWTGKLKLPLCLKLGNALQLCSFFSFPFHESIKL